GGIVNVKYIYEYSGYSITLDNETKLVVSRSRMKEVKEQMARYWRNRV
ncbi:MAG: DNA-binding response regulator, partial [Eubacterium ventriosum]